VFDPKTGELAGLPTAANVGTYRNVIIRVSDGMAAAALPAFSIAVTQIENGSASLSWVPPTLNEDGTALVNLSGYRIYYGRDQKALNQKVEIPGTGITNYVVANLAPATWYFSVKAYTSANMESKLGVIASAAIP
jgi:hypothetical protein